MEQPSVVRWLHQVFNPVRQYELRNLEKSRVLGGVKADEYERRRAEIMNPNDTSYVEIYAALGFFVALAVVIAVILLK
jgi:hypothetical protein